MPVIKFHQNQLKASACWRLYGTWSGEPSCEKLKFVTHCRNCDVFENAARQSLANGGHNSAGGLSLFAIEELIEKEKKAGDCSTLPFRIGINCFAVPSDNIVTITDTVIVHSIPYNKDPMLKGLVAVNNEIFSLINIVQLLDIETASLTTVVKAKKRLYKRILVVDLGHRCVAFFVDEVYQIHRYFKTNLLVLEKDSPFQEVSYGVLPNSKQWESDCIILNPQAVQTQLEKKLR